MTTSHIDVPRKALRGPLAGTWRTVLSAPLSGAANMALDHALTARARRTGEKVLRVYTWSQPTLSLGRHQVARGRFNAESAKALGIALVRRPTGGRALLHHREVTYSVTAPLGREDSVREWYAAINSVLLGALTVLGVRAQAARVEGRTPVPGSASCFVRADEGEISFDGRKLVGSALLREENALLQHGSILLEDDQAVLTRLLPSEEAPAPAGTLRQALGRVPPVRDVADALVTSLRDAGATDLAVLEEDPRLAAEALEAERLYASDAWTYRC